MNTRKSKFVSEPKHALDFKSMKQTTQAVNSLLNSKIIIGKEAKAHHSDSNVIYEIPDTTQEQMFPFKIYNIRNFKGDAPDSRTFQIRSGLVGFRSNYLFPDSNLGGTLYYYQGNWELPLIATGTDSVVPESSLAPWQYSRWLFDEPGMDFFAQPTSNVGGSVTLDDTGLATLICGNDDVGLNPPNVQIVIPIFVKNTDTKIVNASFWIKIIDDPDAGPYTELWGKCSAGDISNPVFGATDITQHQEITFAIGLVHYAINGGLIISNAQTGHLLNRYLQLSPNPTAPAVPPNGLLQNIAQIFRGKWTSNALSGKMIYPGDIVIDDTVNHVVTGLGNVFYSYIYGDGGHPTPKIVTTAPNVTAGFGLWGVALH